MCQPFTEAELAVALHRAPAQKAAGPDGVHNEFLKPMGPAGRAALLELYNESWREGVVPAQWRLVYALNPMVGIISGYRSALLGERFYWDCLFVSLLVAIVLFMAGAVYFRRVERRFADIV